MSLTAETLLAHVKTAFATRRNRLARAAHNISEARKRRIEQERDFYRKLRSYCRARNLSSLCEDDWKTAAYDNHDDKHPADAKRTVPCAKTNLPV